MNELRFRAARRLGSAAPIRRWTGRPSGLVLPAVLVCMMVVMTISTVLLRTVARQHQQSRLQQQNQQAFWIAESASLRAVTRLQTSPDYEGEMWQLSADSLDSEYAGSARIQVKPDAERGDWLRVAIEARFPDDPIHGTLSQREFTVQRLSSGVSPDTATTPNRPGGRS